MHPPDTAHHSVDLWIGFLFNSFPVSSLYASIVRTRRNNDWLFLSQTLTPPSPPARPPFPPSPHPPPQSLAATVANVQLGTLPMPPRVVCTSMLADLAKSGNQCFPDFPRCCKSMDAEVAWGALVYTWMSIGFLDGGMGGRLSALHVVRVADLSGGMDCQCSIWRGQIVANFG